MTERQADALLVAYVRRKKWEARLYGVSTINALGEAMKPKEQGGSLSSLTAMGFGIRGA